MNIKKIIGKRIAKTRRTQEMNRETLAELADLHPNLVGMIERGEVNTGFENIYKICKALNITLEELFGGY